MRWGVWYGLPMINHNEPNDIYEVRDLHPEPRDLDGYDYEREAENMFSDFLDLLFEESEITLLINRYDYGPDARRGDPHAIAVVEVCDEVLAHYDCYQEFGPHDGHSDCNRILDTMRGGYGGDDLAYALNRAAEEEMLGRPLFPNEY